MPPTRLLQIRTSFVSLEIHGPSKSKSALNPGATRPLGYLDAAATTAERPSTHWTDEAGALRAWTKGELGPPFFEQTGYRIRVKSLVDGISPVLTHRDPTLLSAVDQYPDDSMCAGPFNFGSQVGLSELEVRVGHQSLTLTLEVFPTKLDYRKDYEVLLAEVSAAGRGLALEYLRATYRLGASEESDATTGVEWLTLLRHEVERLDKALRFIDQHPTRALKRELEDVPTHKVRRLDSSVRRSVLRGRGRGDWVTITGVGSIRSVIPAVRHQETLDTAEHRWLRHNLATVAARLVAIRSSLSAELAVFERSGRNVPARLRTELDEVSRFTGVINRLTELPVFEDVRGALAPALASLTLLGATGYGDAYRSLVTLNLGLSVFGDSYELSVMDVHDLYETWCFLQIVKLVAALTGDNPRLDGIVSGDRSGLRVRLRRGESNGVVLERSDRKILVAYSPSFSGLTGDQRPDIIVRFSHPGWPDIVVVLDAKYRVDGSDEYRRRFGTPGPPQDAINALHRYRDAIVVDSVGRGLERPVVRGAALFPLSAEQSQDFGASRLFQAVGVLGIGALPFLPGNLEAVSEWLSHLLSLSLNELSEAGPPFAALSRRSRGGSVGERPSGSSTDVRDATYDRP